jgi:hypothetical protein
MWHLHYDGEAEPVAHVCDFHRAIAQGLACPDQRQDGDCDHVQHRVCDCTECYPCAVCPDEVMVA